jgi:hypothetical protein
MGTTLRRDGHVLPAYVTPVIEGIKIAHIFLQYPSFFDVPLRSYRERGADVSLRHRKRCIA